jgi:hypothetical protein
LEFYIQHYVEEKKSGIFQMLVGNSDPIEKSIEAANLQTELHALIERNSQFNLGIAEILKCKLSL